MWFSISAAALLLVLPVNTMAFEVKCETSPLIAEVNQAVKLQCKAELNGDTLLFVQWKKNDTTLEKYLSSARRRRRADKPSRFELKKHLIGNGDFTLFISSVETSLDVNVLDCDTIGQAKEKILQSFKTKFGHCYQFQINDIDIEFEKDGIQQKLQEVDNSSKVLENGVTMLNTIGHYKIPDGALISVTKKKQENLSTQESIKDDDNYTTKYCHLIETDLPEVDDQQQNGKKRKKLKLKEVYLTKLLSTKVAIHSFVEKLFQTIWGIPNNKVPVAIKYFFDFLDLQAKNKMITDPDVLHIWKTNSLPLRFWVNILKNPQFVFDMEKSPHLDACLSVIAQAFMDSFSLSDQQLGKYAPTNKLLYAKDIPRYKTEVKAYYKHIQDLPEFTKKNLNDFLLEESKKHKNEFNEQAAMAEIYKFITAYFDVVLIKLEQNDASGSLKQQLLKVKGLFCERKSCKWE